MEEIDELINNLSNKLIKLELENKNLPWYNFHASNWGFNPQNRRSHPHILQRERKEQQNHIHPPSYIEYDPEEQIQDTNEVQGNLYSYFSNEEQEVIMYEYEGGDLHAMLNDGEIENY